MDHLPVPSIRNRPSEERRPSATMLVGNVHDGHERVAFMEYPLQRGMTVEELCAGTFLPEKAHDAATLVQNWLYFGLLEEFFQEAISIDDFTVVGENSQRFICTRLLPEYGTRWIDRLKVSDEPVRHEMQVRLRNVFRECARFFQLFLAGTHRHYPDDFATYLNPLSVVFETLQFWKCTSPGLEEEGEPIVSNFTSQATAELVQSGWCPFMIANILLPSGSPSLFGYAKMFKERPSFILQNHSDCSANECVVFKVDPATYKSKHRSLFCENEHECTILRPDLNAIRDTIQSGKIPIISYNENKGLEVLPHDEHSYVAISHVWADGMGSTSEKGLPECQIKFLNESAIASFNYLHDETLDTVPFWIDSLCIPALPEIRGAAIGLMAETYSSASAVVVIDAMMLEVSTEDTAEEQLFIMHISTWVQRLWTLQEVLLSKQLLFRVSDGLIDFRTYFTDEIVAAGFQNPLTAKLLGWFAQLMITPFINSMGGQKQTSLDVVALHLAKRTSSRHSDEIIAIAGLFGLNTKNYIPLDANQRMAKFLIEHNDTKVPYDILFLHGPKLPVPNFKWAPQSLMRKEGDLGQELKGTHDEVWSLATEQGLVGRNYRCFLLQDDWPDKSPPRNYRVHAGKDKIFTVLFSHNVELKRGDIPIYNALLLAQDVEQGEEYLAAACKVAGSVTINIGETVEEALHLELTCYVHVFNEDRNLEWNQLPISNTLRSGAETVLIS